MSSTFQIIQEKCSGCGTCVDVAPDYIELNDDGVAHFIGGQVSEDGTMTNVGTEDAQQLFTACEVCPLGCIEEIG
jgi:ferredoxin